MTVNKEMVNVPQLASKRKKLLICGALFLFILIFITIQSTDKLNRIHQNYVTSYSFDYTHLINIDFKFNILPLVCENRDVFLIMVHSAVGHFDHRKVIRETWGQHNSKMKILFLVGVEEDLHEQTQLEKESEQFHDLVQGSFIDSYRNLTYKHVMAFKYTIYHCPTAQFVLKVDDDVFVNMPNMLTFIETYNCRNQTPKAIICNRLWSPPVLREGKWQTFIEEYPESNYPTHCSGFAILYPYEVLYTLYTEAQKSEYFWIDDVQVSGILAKRCNISHIGLEALVLSDQDVRNMVDFSFENITKPFLFGRINLDEHQIRTLWQFVTQHPPKTNILDYIS